MSIKKERFLGDAEMTVDIMMMMMMMICVYNADQGAGALLAWSVTE